MDKELFERIVLSAYNEVWASRQCLPSIFMVKSVISSMITARCYDSIYGIQEDSFDEEDIHAFFMNKRICHSYDVKYTSQLAWEELA
jgi:hypothetical protein